jgi:hypothetical protein
MFHDEAIDALQHVQFAIGISIHGIGVCVTCLLVLV